MIYGIEGPFGSGKTSLAVYISRSVALQTAKDIAKNLTISGNVILSNIKMDKNIIKNYFYFEDDKLLEILRTANAVNDLERLVYGEYDEKSEMHRYYRGGFSRFYIFFDEVGALANNHIKLQDNNVYAEYINQNRKNFQDIYIITAKGEQSNKTLRQMVDWWYYSNPLSSLPILRDFAIIRRCMKDPDGNIVLDKYLGKDQNGDWVTKTKPVDQFVDWYWRPGLYKLYDDLHKNIKDPDKYLKIHSELLKNILDSKQELIKPFMTDEKFEKLRTKILTLNPGKYELDNNIPNS